MPENPQSSTSPPPSTTSTRARTSATRTPPSSRTSSRAAIASSATTPSSSPAPTSTARRSSAPPPPPASRRSSSPTRSPQEFRTLWDRMGLTYNRYIRTTDPLHKRGAQKLFAELYNRGAIYLSSYTGQLLRLRGDLRRRPPGTIGPDGAAHRNRHRRKLLLPPQRLPAPAHRPHRVRHPKHHPRIRAKTRSSASSAATSTQPRPPTEPPQTCIAIGAQRIEDLQC